MKRCKICHIEAELTDGRCHSCQMAKEATDHGMTYGKVYGDDCLIEVIHFASFEDVITQCEILDFDALMSFDEVVLDGALAQWKGAVVC